MKEKLFLTPDSVTAAEIKELRKKLNFTQREFADFIRCSKSTVERWEMSREPVTGIICLLISMLQRYPEYAEAVKIPPKYTPVRLWYMYKQNACTLIDVNEMKREVYIKNYTDNIMFRAFGTEENPNFEMYEEFLKTRCFPESRDKMKLILRDLELPFYDPMMIIEKTQGRMAEDDFWIKIER